MMQKTVEGEDRHQICIGSMLMSPNTFEEITLLNVKIQRLQPWLDFNGEKMKLTAQGFRDSGSLGLALEMESMYGERLQKIYETPGYTGCRPIGDQLQVMHDGASDEYEEEDNDDDDGEAFHLGNALDQHLAVNMGDMSLDIDMRDAGKSVCLDGTVESHVLGLVSCFVYDNCTWSFFSFEVRGGPRSKGLNLYWQQLLCIFSVCSSSYCTCVLLFIRREQLLKRCQRVTNCTLSIKWDLGRASPNLEGLGAGLVANIKVIHHVAMATQAENSYQSNIGDLLTVP
ncbi:hypothetical protein BKA83DRAFT_4130681 [Pisolithus microcarpus]|nr:hypothetical protein BKA83DRAFT_4130681 [Pisolithus microcarpus]